MEKLDPKLLGNAIIILAALVVLANNVSSLYTKWIRPTDIPTRTEFLSFAKDIREQVGKIGEQTHSICLQMATQTERMNALEHEVRQVETRLSKS